MGWFIKVYKSEKKLKCYIKKYVKYIRIRIDEIIIPFN